MLTDAHHMSNRLTVGLDADNADWLDDEHEERDRSKAWVVNEAIRAVRGEQSTYLVSDGEQRTGAHHTTPVKGDAAFEERLEEAEQRIADLEAATDAPAPPQPQDAPEPSPDTEPAEPAHRAASDDATGDTVAEVEHGRAQVVVRADSLRAAAEEAVADAQVPGRAAGVERVRREALLWAWDYLREHEHCTSSEIGNATFGAFWDELMLNYSVSPRYPAYAMWDSYLRDELRKLPGVEGPGRRGKDWFFNE